MQAVACDGEAIEAEYRTAVLGDRRREKRLRKLAGALAEEPAASFPRIAADDAELEATYRFLGNEAITPEGILAGHYARTVERAAEHGSVIAIHDTSIFEFSGEGTREGLGPLRGNGQGFLGHYSLLVAEGEQRKPLGVSSVQTIIRGEPKRKKRTAKQLYEDPSKESTRWFAGVSTTEQRLVGIPAVHVMDREADSYELYAQMQQAGYRFVIRAAHDRPLVSVCEGIQALSVLLASTPAVLERQVPLSARQASKFLKNRRIHPARRSRLARLAISGVQVQIQRPKHVSAAFAPSLTVNAVQVREVETHGEFEPVEWTLITTEPIATAADLGRIVDIYRARWVIEEYFKALKSGCAYEKRQLESSHSLLNALAVFTPIAWRLLLLRTLARDDTEVAAGEALTDTQIEVLRATRKKPLPEQLTARQALLAIAALGGHITNNGEPGWQVLSRGYQKLLVMETTWAAARAWFGHPARSDQS